MEQYNFKNDIILHKTQKCELEIMKDLHIFLTENNLKYSLCYGTALGAVRHKGFIPWDDDIDIVMPREDYDKFIELWKDTDKYILVNKDTNTDFTQNFTKIKNRNTIFLQKEDVGRNYHKGIFVDVFPADRIPNGYLRRKVFYANCLINLLFTRNHNSKSNFFVRFVESILLNIFSEQTKLKILYKSRKYLTKFNSTKEFDYIFLGDLRSCSLIHPANIFDDLVLNDFEDTKFYIFKQSDKLLKTVYGNYMEFPPKEKQKWTHSPIEVSFGDT